MLVPATGSHLRPSSDLGDLIGVARARLASAPRRCLPMMLIAGGCSVDRRTGRPGRRRWCAVRCPAPRRRTSARAGWPLPAPMSTPLTVNGRSHHSVFHGRGDRRRPARARPACATPTVPIGQSELSMSMVCLARSPCGVLVSMWTPYAASAAGAGPVLAQPQARATTSATAASAQPRDVAPGPRYALAPVPATSSTTSNSSSDAPVATGLARWPACASMAGPVAHAWNASSDSHCVTTK